MFTKFPNVTLKCDGIPYEVATGNNNNNNKLLCLNRAAVHGAGLTFKGNLEFSVLPKDITTQGQDRWRLNHQPYISWRTCSSCPCEEQCNTLSTAVRLMIHDLSQGCQRVYKKLNFSKVQKKITKVFNTTKKVPQKRRGKQTMMLSSNMKAMNVIVQSEQEMYWKRQKSKWSNKGKTTLWTSDSENTDS